MFSILYPHIQLIITEKHRSTATHTHRTTKTSQHTNWMATNKFNINMIVLFRFMFTRKQFNKHNINKYLPYLNVIILSPTIKQKQNKKQNTKEAKEKNISMFWLIFWQIFGTIHVCVCIYKNMSTCLVECLVMWIHVHLHLGTHGKNTAHISYKLWATTCKMFL